jgi:hypothetical protein
VYKLHVPAAPAPTKLSATSDDVFTDIDVYLRALVKAEAFKDAGEFLDYLLAGEAHLFIVVNVCALVSACFSDSVPKNLLQVADAGITESGVEIADDLIRPADQILKT